ncbi:MAG: NEW3 domain-containing protein [Phycisphaerales bacterium]|nr:NEW3 domain-containing protein [Phycisphaerales bacterium]
MWRNTVLNAGPTAFILTALTLSACTSDDDQRVSYERSTTDYYATDVGRTEQPRATQERAGTNRVRVNYPSGANPMVMLEQSMPEEVAIGKPFEYQITVTNLTDNALQHVEVVNKLPANFKMERSQPEGQLAEGMYRWNIGNLGPKESRAIQMRGVGSSAGSFESCAMVTFIPGAMACATSTIVEPPQIEMTAQAPSMASRCDELEYRVIVTNTGAGPARDVTIQHQLPEGFTVAGAQPPSNLGTIRPGESKHVTIRLKPAKAGEFNIRSVATSPDGLKDEASAKTDIGEPALKIAMTGPQRDFIGTQVPYEVTVTNTGTFAAENAFIELRAEGNAEFLAAADGGQRIEKAQRWRIGNIGPGESRTMKFQLRGLRQGPLRIDAIANAECAQPAQAMAQMTFEGIAALLLEVVDLNDPVRVGDKTTYTITVTNQGSEDATNVRINCELEDNMGYVSATGASAPTAVAAKVAFAPMPRLKPGDKATWQVTVQGRKPADTRFAVQMTSDQLDRPVEETESTHVYGSESMQPAKESPGKGSSQQGSGKPPL